MPGGGPLCWKVLYGWLDKAPVGRRPLYREEALCAGRFSVLRGLKEAPICREEARLTVPNGPILLYAERIEGGPYAERRPLCR